MFCIDYAGRNNEDIFNHLVGADTHLSSWSPRVPTRRDSSQLWADRKIRWPFGRYNIQFLLYVYYSVFVRTTLLDESSLTRRVMEMMARDEREASCVCCTADYQ
jgi:hypothetical protein